MKGADEFYNTIQRAVYRGLGSLIDVNQELRYGGDSRAYKHGKVIFVTSSHARGNCFRIILMDGTDKLEVYGITGGNPGWTETYGWVKKGNWVKPILQYLRDLESEILEYDQEKEAAKREREREANKHIGQKVNKFNNIFRGA